MNLTASDIERLAPFRNVIRHVANGGNTTNGDVWHTCNQIKFEHTGGWSRSDCNSCKIELIQEFENAIQEYEKQNG